MEMNLIPARRLTDFDITNDKNEDLGQVQDFMIDAASGRIMYAVVAFGGTLGFTDKWLGIPWEALCWSPEQHKFIGNFSRQTLETAPGIDKAKWPDHYMESDAGWMSNLYANFSCKPFLMVPPPNAVAVSPQK
ncbi:Sporulation protein YlmC, PRC-barrel domain family [Dehalogenimonas formicexedens]|uniref:Sporulation protein YlmC, PRC-barrel domain family n=1 Tax=Dehalogenimonas formicexedens TaxID=1839801 RepID=A0A1P8F981_9CHLR|nr:PRC-barrel domain-containing protein [Dehalogenimonas formicexedens]APV45024.1 Sporulation protein YlmC, PRC-barrel domain family [Dehalogenimonas formicexedens]